MIGSSPHRLRTFALGLVTLGLALALLPRTTSFGQSDPGTPPPADAGGWRTYPDTHPWLAYSGDWQTFPVETAAGGELTASDDPAASLIVRFQGSGIRVLYARGPEGGTFTGQVDWLMTQGDSQADHYSYGHVLVFPGLAPGEHTFTLTNSSGAVWIEAVQVQGTLLEPVGLPTATPVPDQDATWTTYQDADTRLVYGGGTWQTFTIANANGGTLTGTADPGATLTVYFEGTGIRVLHSVGPEGRSLTAQVDGGAIQTADGYADSYSYEHPVGFEGLYDGPHTLTVTNGEGAIWIEAIQVQGNLLAPPPMLVPITATPHATSDRSPVTTSVPESANFGAQEAGLLTSEDTVYMDISSTSELLNAVVNIANLDPTHHYVLSVVPGIYTFSTEQPDYTAIPIQGNITILGAGGIAGDGVSMYPDQVTEWTIFEKTEGAGEFDIFHIYPDATLTLYNVYIRKGGGPHRFSGGGVVNHGTFYLYNSIVEENRSAYYGGGLHNQGAATIINSAFISNEAVDQIDRQGGAGSAIYNFSEGTLNAFCTTFTTNYVEPTIEGVSVYVPFTIPGGAIYTTSSNINVHYCNFINNTAGGQNPYCTMWPQYGFCPLHIRDFASTVVVDAANNYWSNLDDKAVWGSITVMPTHSPVGYGDYAAVGQPCFVPLPPRPPSPSTPTPTPTLTCTPGGPTITPTYTPGGPTVTPTPTGTWYTATPTPSPTLDYLPTCDPAGMFVSQAISSVPDDDPVNPPEVLTSPICMIQTTTTVYVACEVSDPGARGRQGTEPGFDKPEVFYYPAGVELQSFAQVPIRYADPPVTIIWHQVAGTGDTSIWVADKDLYENPILVTQQPANCFIGTVTPTPIPPTPTPTLTPSMTPTPTVTPTPTLTPTGPTPTPQPYPLDLCLYLDTNQPPTPADAWITQVCQQAWGFMDNTERQALLDAIAYQGVTKDFYSLDSWFLVNLNRGIQDVPVREWGNICDEGDSLCSSIVSNITYLFNNMNRIGVDIPSDGGGIQLYDPDTGFAKQPVVYLDQWFLGDYHDFNTMPIWGRYQSEFACARNRFDSQWAEVCWVCQDLTTQLYRKAGYNLPQLIEPAGVDLNGKTPELASRNVGIIYNYVQKVNPSSIRRGDTLPYSPGEILFFYSSEEGWFHSGIVLRGSTSTDMATAQKEVLIAQISYSSQGFYPSTFEPEWTLYAPRYTEGKFEVITLETLVHKFSGGLGNLYHAQIVPLN